VSEDIMDVLNRFSLEAKKYLDLTDKDVSLLRRSSVFLLEKLDTIASNVLNSLLSNEEALNIAKRAGLSKEKAVDLFKYWYRLLLIGSFDERYAVEIFKIGLAHAKSGVSEKLMILNMGAFIRETLKAIKDTGDMELAIALSKIFMWNLCLMIYSYLYVRGEFFRESTGISKELFERLMLIKSKEAYERIRKLIEDRYR